MTAAPPQLAAWLDAVLGAAPIEIDRAAGAMLRVCRDHAGALRDARSAQLDRALAPALAELATWLLDQVAGDWLLPGRLVAPLTGPWRQAHQAMPGAAAVTAVARLCAEAVDDALGHRFVSIFRRRGVWQLAPGEPFPVVQPDLRRLFSAAGSRAPFVTLPDRREAPIDRTRRLALAPHADGIELAVDRAHAVAAPPPDGAAVVVAALPIAAPTRELDWTDARDGHKVFHDVRPVASADVAARCEQLLDHACARGAAVVVFPELSVDDAALTRIRARLARTASRPALVVAGSRHLRGTGATRNVATLLSATGEVTHAKFNPYFAGEQREDIALVPAEVRAHGVVDDAGRLAFSAVVVICKDFLAPGAQRALEALRPTLVLVPAWSQKTSIFESDAIGLTGKTQATVVVVNQADPGPAGDEDPAVVILTRPLASGGPIIIRRSEVAPPTIVAVSLADEAC
jgi:predicted amidohydrolase